MKKKLHSSICHVISETINSLQILQVSLNLKGGLPLNNVQDYDEFKFFLVLLILVLNIISMNVLKSLFMKPLLNPINIYTVTSLRFMEPHGGLSVLRRHESQEGMNLPLLYTWRLMIMMRT